MKLGLFSSLKAAHFKGSGPQRVAVPALVAAGTGLLAWPFNGDREAILREAGHEIFPVACAGFLVASAVIAVRTGAGKAARTPLYSDEELLSAGLAPARLCAERFLFCLCFSLLITLYALPPLLTAGVVSGLDAAALPRIALLLLCWPMAACSAGDLFRSLLPRRPLLQTGLPLGIMAISLVYRTQAHQSISPLLGLQNLSGARFFTGRAASPEIILLSLGLGIIVCYAGLWLRLLLLLRGGGIKA